MSYSYKCYSDTKDFMKKFVNAEEGAITVSYTHLDVYKRQVLGLFPYLGKDFYVL